MKNLLEKLQNNEKLTIITNQINNPIHVKSLAEIILKWIEKEAKRIYHTAGSESVSRYEIPYGYDHKYTYSEFRYNLKITYMQAAIGLAQLKKLPQFIKARKNNHKRLFEGLKHLNDKIILPKTQPNSDPSWFGFLLTLKDGNRLSRTEIMRMLDEINIQSRL